MLIQLSCVGRAEPSDLANILPALAEATNAPDLDHTRLAAVLDWVRYRKSFRAPVMVRPFGRDPQTIDDGPLAEIAIDVRRAKDIPHDVLVAQIGAPPPDHLVALQIRPFQHHDPRSSNCASFKAQGRPGL